MANDQSDRERGVTGPRPTVVRERVVEFAQAELAGYLGRDAQVVKTSDREFVSVSVATTRTGRGPDQLLETRTLWVKVLAFGQVAEILRGLKKGSPVYAVGPLSYDRWEDASGSRQAPVVRVTDRSGEVQTGMMPASQYARVTLSGCLTGDVAPVERRAGQRPATRFDVQARGQHTVVLQGPLVQPVEERLKAGHRAHLEGRLELHRWQDGQGKSHERVTVVVGVPETQIRVDRMPLSLTGSEPHLTPIRDLPAPTPLLDLEWRMDGRPRR